MTELGKLDVVRLKGAALTVKGDPDMAIAPSSIPIGKEKYLLTNGGFFDPKPALASRKPLGQASLSSTTWMPILAQYKKYYAEIREGDQFLWAGPPLKAAVPIATEQWENRKPYKNIASNLVHADQGNDRLAICIVGKDKYKFAYMGVDKKGDNGVDVDKLRKLMDTFLRTYAGTSISATTTALNLNGGGSVYVAWRSKVVEKVIARGRAGAVPGKFAHECTSRGPQLS